MLTKDDIKALKKADYLIIDWKRGNGSSNTATIECVRCAKEPLEPDLRYRFQCTGNARNHTRWDNGDTLKIESVRECLDLYHSQATPESTIVGLLRANDEINLEFWINNSELLDRAGLISEMCIMRVRRGKGETLSFRLFDQISAHDGSCYKMTTERANG